MSKGKRCSPNPSLYDFVTIIIGTDTQNFLNIQKITFVILETFLETAYFVFKKTVCAVLKR